MFKNCSFSLIPPHLLHYPSVSGQTFDIFGHLQLLVKGIDFVIRLSLCSDADHSVTLGKIV